MIMEIIKNILFGKAASGENIIKKQPKFTTVEPKDKLDFNNWSYLLHTLKH